MKWPFIHKEAQELLRLIAGKRWAEAHRQLQKMDMELAGEESRICLVEALHTGASPELFRKIITKCPYTEHSGRMEWKLTEQITVTAKGTLLTLAAALNRPEHVKVLLEAGYDPNSASLESVAAFQLGDFSAEGGAAVCGGRGAESGNKLSFRGRLEGEILCATPLAAAVACGSLDAAKVLLRRGDVWKAESAVVCRAAVFALQLFRDDPRQALAGMIFTGNRGKNFDVEELVRTCDLQIRYGADICSYEMMKAQIDHGFCKNDDVRAIARQMEDTALCGRETFRARIRKMDLLARNFPEVCSESRVAGLFLREGLRRCEQGQPYERLLRRWKQLCGEDGDLSWAALELYTLKRPKLQAVLKELSADLRLVMDTDAFGIFTCGGKGELMDLLTHVELRHNQGLEGISALAGALLEQQDLQYLRRAAQLGAFAGEDPKEMLAYLEKKNLQHLRAVVLTYGGQGQELAPPRWKQEHRGKIWKRCWHPDRGVFNRWIEELAHGELDREECLRRLQMMPATHLMWFPLTPNYLVHMYETNHPRWQELHFSQPEGAVCGGTQTLPLQLMMEFMPEKLEKRYEVAFCDTKVLNLEGTPLVVAAALGRTELVKLLLDAGVDPDERGYGTVSALKWFGQFNIPLTAVMAAIYYGEEETARLLIERGAACDLTAPAFRTVLARGDEKTLEVASRIPGIGFEQLDAQFLENIRNRKPLF